MRVTNTANLPAEFLSAVSNDHYDNQGSDYSVTDLIAPAQQVALKKKYKDDIVHDAADLIWILLGRAIHQVIEYSSVPDSWREQRKFIETRGLKISGQADIYNPVDGIIKDVKSTSVYKTRDGLPDDWEKQLNLYAAIWRENGFPVKRLRVLAVYRDWRSAEALKNKNYPATALDELQVPCWRHSVAMDYLNERIQAHMDAQCELETAGGEGLVSKPSMFGSGKMANPYQVRRHEERSQARNQAVRHIVGSNRDWLNPKVDARTSWSHGLERIVGVKTTAMLRRGAISTPGFEHDATGR